MYKQALIIYRDKLVRAYKENVKRYNDRKFIRPKSIGRPIKRKREKGPVKSQYTGLVKQNEKIVFVEKTR